MAFPDIVYHSIYTCTWPARWFLPHRLFRRSPTLWLTAFTIALVAGGAWSDSTMGRVAAYTTLLLCCLSFSLLNHCVHRQKRQVIEGHMTMSQAKLLAFGKLMPWHFLTVLHLALLISLTLVLQQLALATGESLFRPSQLGLGKWMWYTVDMVAKSLLFDIPEIYDLQLAEITHVGFWGSSAVFSCRLVILVLVLGSALRAYHLHQWMWESVWMLDKHRKIAQTRLLSLVRMYPQHLKKLATICHEVPPQICDLLLETLGKTQRREVVSTFEYYFRFPSSLSHKLAALRGFEFLQQGDISLIQQLWRDDGGHSEEEWYRLKQQSCHTLGAWKNEESAHMLCQIALDNDSPDLRHAAIESLRDNRRIEAIPTLIEIMQNRERHKEERFKAKDALVAIGAYTPEIADLQKTLLDSPYVDNRRFAALVLGGVGARQSLGVLLDALHKEEDPDARIYIAKAVGLIARKARTEEKMGDDVAWEDAVYALVASAEDVHPFVRVASLRSLGLLSWFIVKNPNVQSEVYHCIKKSNEAEDVQTMDAAADLWEKLSHVLGARYSLQVYHPEATAVMPDDLMPTYEGEATLLDPEQRTVDHSELFFEDTNTVVQIPSRYEFLHPISYGKLSHIFKVNDKQDGRHKALKQLHWGQGQELFLKEIDVASRLNHPNIIPILEVYRNTEPPCFTMPYLPNPILSIEIQHRRNSGEKWSCRQFRDTFHSLCEVVRYLHSQDIVHLDLKPANLFYQDPQIVLFDFNIAQYRYPDRCIALPPRERRGTPFYMAPEQYYGGELDFATDIYALAIIAYELLTLQLPFGIDPRLLLQLRPDIPPQVFDVLTKAGHVDLRQRHSSVEELWQELDRTLP